MSVSVFVKAFDPLNKAHVQWLKKMNDIAETLGDPTRHQTLVAEINTNPMKVKLDHRDALSWVEIHFGVAMKYTKAVLKGEAIVPMSKDSGKMEL